MGSVNVFVFEDSPLNPPPPRLFPTAAAEWAKPTEIRRGTRLSIRKSDGCSHACKITKLRLYSVDSIYNPREASIGPLHRNLKTLGFLFCKKYILQHNIHYICEPKVCRSCNPLAAAQSVVRCEYLYFRPGMTATNIFIMKNIASLIS